MNPKPSGGAKKTKGDFWLPPTPLLFSFLGKKISTIYRNSLLNLERVQEDSGPEDLHLNGFLKRAVSTSKIFVPGEH